MPALRRAKRDFLWWGDTTECISTDDTACSDDEQAKYLRDKLRGEREAASKHEESLIHEANSNTESGGSTHVAFVDLENHAVGMQGWPVILVVALFTIGALLWCISGCCRKLAKVAGRAAGVAAGGVGAAASSVTTKKSRRRSAKCKSQHVDESDSEDEKPARKIGAVNDPRRASPSPEDVAMAYAALRARDERAPAYGRWQPARPGLSDAGGRRRFSLDGAAEQQQRHYTLEEARRVLGAQEAKEDSSEPSEKAKRARVQTGP